jgi:hypothetical protein
VGFFFGRTMATNNTDSHYFWCSKQNIKTSLSMCMSRQQRKVKHFKKCPILIEMAKAKGKK